MRGRWSDYVIAFGGSGREPEELWTAAAAISGASMYVLGVGFDPRALIGLRRFLDAMVDTRIVVGLIELPPPTQTSGTIATELAAAQQAQFESMVEDYEVRRITHEAVQARSNAGTRVARVLTGRDFLEDVSHLVIDISSLPASLYFPVVAGALSVIDRGEPGYPHELQVVACENAAVDGAIRKLGVSDAAVISGFPASIALDSEPNGSVIWAPVVGEQAGPAMEAIHALLGPDDVCPVLPFPAVDPRRPDDLVLEHQLLLMDTFMVTPSNVIYADERNPFDLYRTLSELQANYRLALKALEPTEVVVSTHSSKLLSVGALLAAIEHHLPLVAAPAIDYEVDREKLEGSEVHNQLTCAWLAGMPYGATVAAGIVAAAVNV